VDLYNRYNDRTLGIITDAAFPKGGQHDMEAGLKASPLPPLHGFARGAWPQRSAADRSQQEWCDYVARARL
jgi:hypothetical protein